MKNKQEESDLWSEERRFWESGCTCICGADEAGAGPLAGTGMTLRGDEYYAPQYWQPEKYWQLQDALWKAPLKGRVRVGELESVESKAASGKP